VQSVRALLEEHRKNAPCFTCHSVMDPLASRSRISTPSAVGELGRKRPVDAPANLRMARRQRSVALRKALMKHPEQFVRTMTAKMMTYALGRAWSITTCQRCARSSGGYW